MKKIYQICALLLFLVSLTAPIAHAQTCPVSARYTKQVFPRINVTKNIVYERADKYDPAGINWPEDIKLDFYEPANDGLAKRPLVIFFFGGAFLLGDKGDADVKAWCDSLAHHGYCAAAVNYRLGFNAASTASAIRAVYRAVQDSRASIRFFKEKASLYKIDTTQIFLGGESAGAITALHTAYLNTDAKAPSEIHGSLTEWQDLGCLDCTGSYKRHTVDPKGIISLWGAIYNLGYIEPSINVPTLLIHGTADFIVPFTEGRPFTGQFPSTFPYVYGSTKLNERFGASNIYREFYPYEGLNHVFYGLPTGIVTFPNQYWSPVFNQGRNFLLQIMGFNTPVPTGNLTAAFGSTQNYTVTTPRIGSTFCWNVTGGTVLSYTNNGSVARIKWNTSGTRRISVTETDYKQLAGKNVTVNIGSVARLIDIKNNLLETATSLTLNAFPNPIQSGGTLRMTATTTEEATAICTISTINGQNLAVFKQNLAIGDNTITHEINNFAAGVYLVTISSPNARKTIKIVVE